MAVKNVTYRATLTSDTAAHPTEQVWGDFPLALIQEDPTYGAHFFEDFRTFGKSTAVATNVGRYDGDGSGAWISYEDNSCTITSPVQTTPAPNGLARFSITNAANKAAVLELGYGTAYSSGSIGSFQYTDKLGGKLWFEARFQVSQIAANTNALFFGLSQSGTAVVPAAATSTTTLFDSASAVGNVDLLGFDVLPAGPSVVRAVYGKNASARTNAGTVATLVASTFITVGFVIDPIATFTGLTSGITPVRKKMRWFLNGIEQQFLSDTLTSPFPTGAVLTPVIHVQGGSAGTAFTVDVDWIRAGQVYIA